jgi:transposase
VLERENRELKSRIAELEKDLAQERTINQELREKHERDQQEAKQLKDRLEKEQRAGKRQASPFSKGEPKKKPRRPGRKAGAKYGKKGHRTAPTREPDQTVEAELPACCPRCNNLVEETDIVTQLQLDLPERIDPVLTKFNVHVGSCVGCGMRVQGSHPHQTSDALGAAASQLGPRALSLAADLKVSKGLSYGKIADLFQELFGIAVTRGGLCHGLQRLARAAEPTYEALKDAVRNAAVVSPDETGWRVAGLSAWLWVFVTTTITIYTVEAGRGFREAVKVLGEEFRGVLARDGWASYRRFTLALHQTCIAHLLRRCKKLLTTAKRGSARVPHKVRRILKAALELRDRHRAGELSDEELKQGHNQLKADLEKLLTWNPKDNENRKLLNHLKKESEVDALFTFLERPDTPATNFMAEQELRPPITTRKNCGGGNRSWAGAKTLAVLASVLRTSRRQGRDPTRILVTLLRNRATVVAQELLPQPDTPPAGHSSP